MRFNAIRAEECVIFFFSQRLSSVFIGNHEVRKNNDPRYIYSSDIRLELRLGNGDQFV
jgi:hypothetical protein